MLLLSYGKTGFCQNLLQNVLTGAGNVVRFVSGTEYLSAVPRYKDLIFFEIPLPGHCQGSLSLPVYICLILPHQDSSQVLLLHHPVPFGIIRSQTYRELHQCLSTPALP